MSCHAWEDQKLGGVLSNRNSTILGVHARYNADYFKNYVYEPSRFIPDVLMPAHPHYTDDKIEAIAAFLIKSSLKMTAKQRLVPSHVGSPQF